MAQSEHIPDLLVLTLPTCPTSTGQPRDDKKSRKCEWTLQADSTFFRIYTQTDIKNNNNLQIIVTRSESVSFSTQNETEREENNLNQSKTKYEISLIETNVEHSQLLI